MVVAAYNMNSVNARNILASVSDDDILIEQITCVARVEVENAFFMDSYAGPGQLRRPFMRMLGKVSSVFIEPDENRLVPCYSNEIQLMEPESVQINYTLSTPELQELVGLGLYYEGFQPPSNLIGNVMEIPLNIVYKGIYETPCCFVEIIDPDKIDTCTKENGYFDLFKYCELSAKVRDEMTADYKYTEMNVSREVEEHLAKLEAEAERQRVLYEQSQYAEEETVENAESIEAIDIAEVDMPGFNRTISALEEAQAGFDKQRQNNGSFDAQAMLDNVEAKEQARQREEFANNSSIYDALTDDSSKSKYNITDKFNALKEEAALAQQEADKHNSDENAEGNNTKFNADGVIITDDMTAAEAEHAKAEADAQAQNKAAMMKDVAMDAIARAKAEDLGLKVDTSGHGATIIENEENRLTVIGDGLDGFDTTGMSQADIEKAKRKAAAAKNALNVAKVDGMNDLNQSIAEDEAKAAQSGFGGKRANSVQSLIDSVMPKSNKDDGRSFL